MDDRTDPIEIIARVSDGKQRALEVWLYKAGKEGWSVTVESTSTDRPGDQCAVVDIEGLRYQICYGKRVRRRMGVLPAGQHVIEAAVKVSMGESTGVTWTTTFALAAWAEPIIEDE